MTEQSWMPLGPFGFDGCGVNDYSNEYHPRIATLTGAYAHNPRYGRLLAAAPTLLTALERWEKFARDNAWTDEDCTFLADTRAAIAQARGEGKI